MNILTFDIEEWYLEQKLYGGRAYRFQKFDEGIKRLLDELESREYKATFFCVGKLAADYPQVVQAIVERGHEVGCHSNEHTWLDKMTEDELYKDTMEAIRSLEDVSGQKVVTYRAPAFSITQKNKWAVSVLAACGIENDASIFPTSRDYGGYKGFPQDTPCIVCREGAKLKEFPISLTSIGGKRIAYSGGGYFRILPYWFVNKTMNRLEYNICYFHLNDLINEKIPLKSKEAYEAYFKEPGTLKNRVVRYVKSNIGSGDTYKKLSRLLTDHRFTSIRDCGIDWTKVETITL